MARFGPNDVAENLGLSLTCAQLEAIGMDSSWTDGREDI